MGADDGGGEDRGDLRRPCGRRHGSRRNKFDVLHDGSGEWQLSQMMRLFLRSGWQRSVILYIAKKKLHYYIAKYIMQE